MMSQKTRATCFRIDASERTSNGALRVHGRLTKTGVFGYKFGTETVRERRSDSEVFRPDSLDSLVGVPVTIDHPRSMFVDLSNWHHLAVGNVIRVDAKAPYVEGTLQLHDPRAIAMVEEGKLVEVSLGYSMDPVEALPSDEEADFLQTNIVYNHAALGPQGWARLGRDVSLRLDSDGNLDFEAFRMDSLAEGIDPLNLALRKLADALTKL
jgi:hypothetical protein